MRRSVLLVPLLLLPACGDDVRVERTGQAQAPSAAAVEPTPEPTATEQVAPPAPAPTPSATPRRTAAPAATAAPAVTGPAEQGDVDGDGEADEIRVAQDLTVVLSGSGRRATSGFESDTTPAVAGAEDVDRDGRAEVFLRTGQGASTAFLTPFRYDGKALAPLTLDGEQVRLGVGGSTTHGDGFSCTDAGTLVVRSASSDDGTTFTVTSTTYRVDGHRLVQVSRSTAQARGMDDPRVGQAYLVDCRSVGEGG